MAIKLPDFFKKLSVGGAKSRILLVVMGLSAAGLVVYFGSKFLGGAGDTGGGSSVAGAPSSLQTVPGGKMSPEFYRAVVQANAQAASQAQISGGSAVPTLINVPGEQSTGQQGECTIICSDQSVDVANDINDLVKSGKLAQDDANKLLQLAKNNVTPEEYEDALNALVRQGKLTPEQARLLLERYKKQYQNRALTGSASVMDGMIKSGQLSLDTANQLLTLQKSGILPSDYADELNGLVKGGKISASVAAQLLSQYAQLKQQEQAKQAAFDLNKMAKLGQINPEVAAGLAALQKKNASVSDYAAELDRLTAAGKMTPETAAKLSAAYKKQSSELGAAPGLDNLIKQEEAAAMAEIDDLEKSGRISKETADVLRDLQKNSASSEQCTTGINQLVQQKKLLQEDANKLLARCQKLVGLKSEKQRLSDMQAKKASVSDYLEELKRAVKAGLVTPETATNLLQTYSTFSTVAAVPAPVANVPGGEGFAKLQQRVQATQATTTTATVGPEAFTAPTAATQAAESDQNQLKQQQLEQYTTAMAGQAQQLLAAWQPPVMQHKGGAEEDPKLAANGKSDEGSVKTTTTITSSEKSSAKPLIKAGTIAFAVLDTAINSDYPDTPVMATIVLGGLKGAKLLGKLTIATTGQDKVTLNFTLMNMENWDKSIAVTAYAIDPDTAHSVLASSVDYHYLKRYGALFAGSFMGGYAKAVMQSGSTTTSGVFGTSSTSSPFSPSDKLAAGLGEIGTNLTTAVQAYVNTPPTVIVDSGVGLGILFMSDVTK